MRRREAAALSALLALVLLAGCGGKQSAADPAMLGKELVSAAAGLPEMSVVSSGDARGEELFPYLSDLDYAKVEGYYFAYAAGGTAEEIAVVLLKDAADAPELEQSLARHVQSRLGIFQNYDPSQVAMVEDGRMVVSGRLAVLAICADPDGVVSAFRDRLD